jgi:DNA-binding protein Fis
VDQGKARAAVGVVLDGRDLAGDVDLVALEVDDPVLLLVTAALVANRDRAASP